MHVYPNFFYSIILPVDKVQNAKKKIWIAIQYKKKWLEKKNFEKKSLKKNPKTHGFYFWKS